MQQHYHLRKQYINYSNNNISCWHHCWCNYYYHKIEKNQINIYNVMQQKMLQKKVQKVNWKFEIVDFQHMTRFIRLDFTTRTRYLKIELHYYYFYLLIAWCYLQNIAIAIFENMLRNIDIWREKLIIQKKTIVMKWSQSNKH